MRSTKTSKNSSNFNVKKKERPIKKKTSNTRKSISPMENPPWKRWTEVDTCSLNIHTTGQIHKEDAVFSYFFIK